MERVTNETKELLWEWIRHLDGVGDRPKDCYVRNFSSDGAAIIRIVDSKYTRKKS